MRIIIFSHPRSCSTYLQNLIVKKSNLQNWGEMVGPKTPHIFKHEDLYTYDNYVTKLVTLHLLGNHFHTQLEDIRWDNIDQVFITERHNIVDQTCSMMYRWTSHTNGNIIDVKSDLFNSLIKALNIFYSAKEFLLQNTNAKVIFYEMFQKQPIEYISELNELTSYNFTVDDCSSIKNAKNYSTLIENYDEVKNIVESSCDGTGRRSGLKIRRP